MDLKPYIHVKLRLIDKETEQPLQGEDYKVFLYDQDVLEDDFLGEASPDAAGCLVITFHAGQFSDWESLREELPDLYFKVLKGEKEIFRSPTAFNANPLDQGDFDMEQGIQIDMGSWALETEESPKG